MAIPFTTWEGHSRCRVVWYSHSSEAIAKVGLEPLIPGSSKVAAFNLRRLNKSGGGVELATNGESDVVSCSWHKNTNQPAGVLSVSLKPRQDYLNNVSPSDVLLVYMRSGPRDLEYLVSIISIDTVGETRIPDGRGATTHTISIQGRDLGKVLMETPLVYDAAFANIVGGLDLFPEFHKPFANEQTIGGPSLVVQQLLATFFSVTQNFVTVSQGFTPGVTKTLPLWRFPGLTDVTLLSLLDTHTFVQVPMVGATITNPTMLQNANNLWSICSMYANQLVNEIFVDVRDLVTNANASVLQAANHARQYLEGFGDSKANLTVALNQEIDEALLPKNVEAKARVINDSVFALVHRQMPYDTLAFYALPATTVWETEIFDSNINKSSHEVYNFFRIRMPGIVENLEQELLFGVTVNRQSIAKHGLKRFEAETIYPFVTQNGGASFKPMFEFYMSLLTTWHAFNENMLSGSISMRLRPDVRVGTRLTLVRSHLSQLEAIDFYVQGVQHTFSPAPGGSRTTVQVVRGVVRSKPARDEGALFWSNEGRALANDPYEVVTPKGIFGSNK